MKIITCTDGTKLRRISRWILWHTNYAPRIDNALWDYVRDGYGRTPSNPDFEKSERYLDYFRFGGRKYALESFCHMGSAFLGGEPYMYKDENGKLGVIGSLYMDGYIFGPAMYMEISADDQYVRLYEEVRE